MSSRQSSSQLGTLCITGATGFIGCRLAEAAFAEGATVVALVREWSRAARLARLGVRMVPGNILDPASLRDAMRGCDVVFHCAVDNRIGGEAHRRSSVDGTRNVMQAALEARVSRVVHLSTVAVYGYRAGPDAATESGAYRYTGDAYSDGKIDSEKIVLEYHRTRGVPVTILRPTIVYGPFGLWTMIPVEAILQRRLVLVDGGTGVCNCLYIDNLVEAILLAAQRGRPGEAYHVSDGHPVSWKEFLEGHARALGEAYLPLPAMTSAEIAAARERVRRSRPSSAQQIVKILRDPHTRQALRSVPAVNRCVEAGRHAARLVLPRAMRHRLREMIAPRVRPSADPGRSLAAPLSQAEVDIYTNPVTFGIAKAERELGYRPIVEFPEGMERTAAWIRWARLGEPQ